MKVPSCLPLQKFQNRRRNYQNERIYNQNARVYAQNERRYPDFMKNSSQNERGNFGYKNQNNLLESFKNMNIGSDNLQ